MMYVIIPLAGPDFDHPSLPTLKPLVPVDGVPLIRRAIESRPWWKSGELTTEGLVFVLRNTPRTGEFRTWLMQTYPGCRIVTLPGLTGGALQSAIAGTSIISDATAPLVIDLVDILYRSHVEDTISERFRGPAAPGAILPVFSSDNPEYSYAHIDPVHPSELRILRTAEKEVISSWASAGTYLFRDTALFLAAAGRALSRGEVNTVRGVHFVCPVINDVIALGHHANLEKVELTDSLSVRLKGCMSEAVSPLV